MGPQWLVPGSRELDARAEKIAQSVVHQGNNNTIQRYWYEGSTEDIQVIAATLVEYAKPEDRNLPRVAEIVKNDVAAWAKFMIGKHPELKSRLSRYINKGEIRSLGEILANTQAETKFLRNRAIAEAIRKDEFYFEECKRHPVSVYLVAPLEVLETMPGVLRLAIGTALAQTMRKTKGNTRLLYVMDEYYALQANGTLPAIDIAFAEGRKFNCQMWACLQNWPELIKLYGELAEHFVDCAGCLQFMSANTLSGSRYVSDMCGRSERIGFSQSVSEQSSYQPAGGGQMFGRWSNSTSVSENLQQVARELILPHEVRQMAADEQILFLEGVTAPVLCKRKPYFATNLKHRARPNPYAPSR